MDLSIIIVNYNHKNLLQSCIDSIIASNPSMRYEIIVVDNGSQYNVKAQIEKLKTTIQNINLRLIQNKENAGFGKANNQGVDVARGKYVLFLNTDIEVLDNAIDSLYEYALRQSDMTIVGGKLLNPDGSDQASCGPYFTVFNTFVMLFLLGDRLGITRSSPAVETQVDWVSGACFMLCRDKYIDVQGFDEAFFMYMEEIELMYRARDVGMQVLFYPHAKFTHIGAATSGSRTKPVLNIYRGLIQLYRIHGSSVGLLMIQFMLKTKARISYILGSVTNNKYLTKTYEEAYNIAKKATKTSVPMD